MKFFCLALVFCLASLSASYSQAAATDSSGSKFLYCSISFSGAHSTSNQCKLEKIVQKTERENPEESAETFDYAKIRFSAADIRADLTLDFGILEGSLVQLPMHSVIFKVNEAGVTFPATFRTQVKLSSQGDAAESSYVYLECSIRNPERDGWQLPTCQ